MIISIVIPNYNGESLIKKNFPEILDVISRYVNYTFDVIIVDDASSDNSLVELSNLKSEVKEKKKYENISLVVLNNSKNLGFSSSVNKGVKEARSKFVILLNSDVIPDKNFIDPLIEHFKNEKLFAVGFMDRSIEGTKMVLRGRGLGKWERGFLVHSRGEVDKSNTLWVSGGSSMVRKEIFEELGGYNTIYNPFYWEDIDLSYRAQKAGYSILFENKSIVEHRHAEGAIKKHYSASFVKCIAYRNQFIFVWENITDLHFIISHILWLPYHFITGLLRFDKEFFIGFFLAVGKIPDIIKKRKILQKRFKRSDTDILSEFIK